MKNNIRKLYIANFLTGLVFWYGIEKLFMRSIGISTIGISVNAIVYVLVSVALDIPTGILADRWNRKYTLMLGIASLGLSAFLMSVSHGLPLYILATAIWGLYTVFTQGTFQAITYDSLRELGREEEYVKHQGRSYGLFLLAISLSSVAGGYLSHRFGYRTSYWLTIIPCLMNLWVLASLREPVFHKAHEDTKIWQHVRESLQLLGGRQMLLILSFLFIAVSVLNYSQNEYAGLYYIALGFGAIGNGWANAGKWLMGAFGQFTAARLSRVAAWGVPLFFAFFMAFSLWRCWLAIFVFMTTGLLEAIVMTNLEGTLQKHTPSHIRATMLSTLTFAYSVIVIPISLVFGLLARHDVFRAYQFTAAVAVVIAAVWFLKPAGIDARPAVMGAEPGDIY